jgi:hypothetical protein
MQKLLTLIIFEKYHHINMKQIKKTAILNALFTTIYIIGVGGFLFYGTMIKLGRNNTFLTPIVFLMLFVCSAAITGYLIFGKPAQMYVDGKKKEAIALLTYTLLSFSVITFIFLALLFVSTK